MEATVLVLISEEEAFDNSLESVPWLSDCSDSERIPLVLSLNGVASDCTDIIFVLSAFVISTESEDEAEDRKMRLREAKMPLRRGLVLQSESTVSLLSMGVICGEPVKLSLSESVAANEGDMKDGLTGCFCLIGSGLGSIETDRAVGSDVCVDDSMRRFLRANQRPAVPPKTPLRLFMIL